MTGEGVTAQGVDGLPVADLSAVELAASTDVAFAAFFVDTRRDMLRLAFLLTGSRGQAEDAVQESYVRLYERWATVDNPGAYLRTAVVNRCSSWHRHRAVARRVDSRVAAAGSYVDGPDELFDALAALSPRRRAVVVLRFYGRLELSEIAQVLGIGIGTVKSTLHRALNDMRGALE
jgi:RNA polymerase sigma factor (sigma-70 family)